MIFQSRDPVSRSRWGTILPVRGTRDISVRHDRPPRVNHRPKDRRLRPPSPSPFLSAVCTHANMHVVSSPVGLHRRRGAKEIASANKKFSGFLVYVGISVTVYINFYCAPTGCKHKARRITYAPRARYRIAASRLRSRNSTIITQTFTRALFYSLPVLRGG